MNNVITILVDSVFGECISNGRTAESSTPFIDSIIPNSLYAKNVFSYGPYTDAATKGLFCGNRTLDDYGYYFGVNSSEYNHYRIFKENGYETVGLYYPWYLISSKVEQYIDHSIYTGGFYYENVWSGKYQYYAEKKKKTPLSDLEYTILDKFTFMLFDCWETFYQNMINGESGYIIAGTKENDIDGYSLLKAEKEKYNTDKLNYINTILDMGMDHPLAKINDYNWNRLVEKETIQKVFKKHSEFFKDLESKEFRLNMRNNFPDAKHIFSGIAGLFNPKKRADFRYLENFMMSLWGNKFLKTKSRNDMWQMVSSMMHQVDAVFDFLDEREQSEKPFYVSMHTEEPHNRLAYFTYDTKNIEMIEEELEYLRPLLNNLGDDYKGHIIYQLSLRYVDLCIKRLFEGLEQRGLLDKTTIMIMADHGSSYTLNPVRKTVVNNFYIENYKTPLVIWNRDKDKTWAHTYEGYYQGGNVFPTLCDTLGIATENKFKEKSIIGDLNGREYVITEYMGPGCPDMLEREVWMSINNKRIFIAVKSAINSTLSSNDIVEIYDLQLDPRQLNNLVGTMRDNKDLEDLLKKLELRFNEIKEDAKNYISSIDSMRFTK